jgi:hypothetical protein
MAMTLHRRHYRGLLSLDDIFEMLDVWFRRITAAAPPDTQETQRAALRTFGTHLRATRLAVQACRRRLPSQDGLTIDPSEPPDPAATVYMEVAGDVAGKRSAHDSSTHGVDDEWYGWLHEATTYDDLTECIDNVGDEVAWVDDLLKWFEETMRRKNRVDEALLHQALSCAVETLADLNASYWALLRAFPTEHRP